MRGQHGEDLELDICELHRLALQLDGALGEVDAQVAALERLLVAVDLCLMSARRSAARTRLRNSRIEKGLVM